MTISTTVRIAGRTFTLTADTAQQLAQTAVDLTRNADRLLEHLPPPEPPACIHGPRVRKSGTNERGQWSAWMCPLPQDRAADRCPPLFD